MNYVLDSLTAWTMVKAAAGIVLAALLCKALGLAAHTLRVLGRRMNHSSGQAVYMAADAVGIAVAWPYEWVIDRADKIVARGSEWRAQRKIWRTEFRKTMSWAEFQAHAAGKPAQDDLANALALFGLTDPFTQWELDARFKQTMLCVHPDKGGSEYLARMANEARALIIERKGWKR